MQTIQQTIKYDVERDREFPRQIMARPGGEKLYGCIQCGTCSATCPVSIFMDYTPRQLMALTRAGFKQEALSSRTIWLCASCYACTVDCPKEIKITDIMYALKRRAIREGVYPKRFPIPVLAREFFKMVRSGHRESVGDALVPAHQLAGIGQDLAARLEPDADRPLLIEDGNHAAPRTTRVPIC